MPCPGCASDNPEVASFCHRCGHSLRGGASGGDRGDAYVAQAGEGVRQLALISTVMPLTSRRTADHYRWAVVLSAGLVLGATALGLLPVAVAAAAVLVPVVYLVYLQDVNLWEDVPVRVLLALFVVTGVLGVVVTLVLFRWVFSDLFATFVSAGGSRGGIGTLSWPALLVFAVLLPLVAELAKNLPAALLARMPQFDDMIDGLTFGVAAGTAYAAAETLVLYSSVFTHGELRSTAGLGAWVLVVVNLMVVKSLIYGTATGIAVAAFSGKGEGYDGVTRSYLWHLAFAVSVNVLYWLGIRLTAYLPNGAALGLLWGVLLLAVLVVRIRVMLQTALLEAAVEDAARQGSSRDTFVETFCPECENMLLVGAQFCVVCGTSVRSTSRQARRAMQAGGRP